MELLSTEAIVLHAFDYLESSRIVRVLTREVGVRSVLARGARRSSRRFGTSIDLFVQGVAELQITPGRELDTLDSFDVRRARPGIGGDLGRFSAASALAELTLRFSSDAADSILFDAVAGALDRLTATTTEESRVSALAGGWRILAALGYGPSLDQCADCGVPVPPEAPWLFSHSAGGMVCEDCGPRARSGRPIPASARTLIGFWLNGEESVITDAEARAHQRLLREFVRERLSDGRPLRAYDVWEHAAWSTT